MEPGENLEWLKALPYAGFDTLANFGLSALVHLLGIQILKIAKLRNLKANCCHFSASNESSIRMLYSNITITLSPSAPH